MPTENQNQRPQSIAALRMQLDAVTGPMPIEERARVAGMLSASVACVEQDFAGLHAQTAAAKNAVAEAEKKRDDARQATQAAERNRDETEAKLAKLTATLNEVKDAIEERDQRIMQQQSELASCKTAINNLKQELHAADVYNPSEERVHG